MFAPATQLEVLDLRHFSSGALRSLLSQEAATWERRLFWDYSRSIELLLNYVDSRSLNGYVALRRGRVDGYAFGVCEAAKAVIGDVFAFGEGEREQNPVCDLLLDHLLDTLQATPGIDRVESQLLLFPHGALAGPYRSRGFQSFARQFMVCRLQEVTAVVPPGAGLWRPERWRPEIYLPAAELIHHAYAGHTDSQINDQYRTLTGAQRFLHNIVHFPGCGVFEPANSWFVRDGNGELEGLILCSRVRADAAHITQLCVRSNLRRGGLGGLLLAHSLAGLKAGGTGTVSLTVTESNVGARRLYERAGFRLLHPFEAWVWQGRPARL